MALFLYHPVVRQGATTGIPALDGDTLFAAILASGVKIIDLGTSDDVKKRTIAEQKEMLSKQVCCFTLYATSVSYLCV